MSHGQKTDQLNRSTQFCLQKNRPVFLNLDCFIRVLTRQNAGLTFDIWAKVRDPGRFFRDFGEGALICTAPINLAKLMGALGYASGDAAGLVKGALESLSVVSVVGVTLVGGLWNESAGTVRPAALLC